MLYILGLILILGLIFSAATGINFIGDLWNKTAGKIKEFTFPKTQKEIVIDNLNSQYDLLDRFFSDTALNLLQNESIPAKDKKAVQNAIQSFSDSKNLISQIESLTKKDNGLAKSLIKKVFDLAPESGPDPTHIPPNCNLVCGE